jgi:O-6-methylguanine DNA methyltransferase
MDEQLDLPETRQMLRHLRELGGVQAPAGIIPAVLERAGLADAYFRMNSAVGQVFVAYNQRGVSALLEAENEAALEAIFEARFKRPAYLIARPPAALIRNIEALLAGERTNELSFDLRGLSEFEQAVLTKAREIPRGQVRPYAWIAAEINHPQAVRAVGTALGHNPVPLLIPCHRVVRSDGRIGNYIFGSEAKRSLLQAEGAEPAQLEQLAGKGVHYLGSDTTHIFCYPTCSHARRITEPHRVSFKSGSQAIAAGYRPCKVCRPALAG